MEEPVRQRIKSIMKDNSITVNSLSNGNRALQRKFNRQINEGAAITVETILSILNAITDLSAEWLLRGLGEKSKSETSVTVEELKAEISRLEGEIRILRELKDAKNKDLTGRSA